MVFVNSQNAKIVRDKSKYTPCADTSANAETKQENIGSLSIFAKVSFACFVGWLFRFLRNPMRWTFPSDSAESGTAIGRGSLQTFYLWITKGGDTFKVSPPFRLSDKVELSLSFGSWRVIFLLLLFLPAAAIAQSSLDKRINFDLQETPIADALIELSEAADINIAFHPRLFSKDEIVSISMQNQSVEELSLIHI